MNVLLVLIDSVNRRHLEAYGCQHVSTPNLKAFSERAWRFDNHFVGSLPCMPARREITTGRQDFLVRPWGSLEPFDQRLPETMKERGYINGLVTDHYHYWEDWAHGYLESFQSVEMIRGHELDHWKPPLPENAPVPRWVSAIEKWRPGSGRQYFANVREFQDEEDFFPAKVMAAASRWIKEYVHSARSRSAPPFFLQVESFDVHEPFHLPEPYRSRYWDGEVEDFDFTCWPPYQDPERRQQFFAEVDERELAFIRSQYYGKLTFVDTWFGLLMKTLDELDLWKETVVIVTTDHGHDLGDREAFGKQYPHYDSHANIPLMIWHPDFPGNGRSISALTQTVDLHSTILDIAGGGSRHVHSRSLLPLLSGQRSRHRDAILYGTFGEGLCCTDGEWTLFQSPDKQQELYMYSTHAPTTRNFLLTPTQGTIRAETWESGRFLAGVDVPQWRARLDQSPYPWEDMLFHRVNDPDMRANLFYREKEQVKRLQEVARRLMNELETPVEQYKRLKLEG